MYCELKNVIQVFEIFYNMLCELDVELQVRGESVTCELADAKKGYLFVSLSFLPDVWSEPKRMVGSSICLV